MEKDTFNSKSGAISKSSYVTIEIDVITLNVVLRSFNYILDNQRDIPFMDDHTLATVDQLLKITTRLNRIHGGCKEEAKISMDFPEWVTYTSYIEYAKGIVPDDEDGVVLEGLAEKYDGLDPVV